MMALKGGAEKVTVVGEETPAAGRGSGQEWRGLPVRVVPAHDALTGIEADDRVLVLSALVLPTDRLLAALVREAQETGRPAVAVPGSAGRTGGAVGPAVLSAGELLDATTTRGGLVEAVRAGLGSARDTGTAVRTAEYRRIDDAAALAATEEELYASLHSIADGYVDRVLNRRLSRWVTRRIIGLPIAPNQVTCFHFFLGMLAAWLFWGSVYWQHVLGALLFQLSVALDCTDGEVARLKYQSSKFGSWLDVAADNVVTIAIFAAVAKQVGVHLGAGLGLTLGALSVTGVLASVGVVYSMARLQTARQPGEASALAATNRFASHHQTSSTTKATLVEAVINEATSRDFSVIVVAFALAGRLEWFAWLAAIGSHLFWMVFAVIQFSLFRKVDAKAR